MHSSALSVSLRFKLHNKEFVNLTRIGAGGESEIYFLNFF